MSDGGYSGVNGDTLFQPNLDPITPEYTCNRGGKVSNLGKSIASIFAALEPWRFLFCSRRGCPSNRVACRETLVPLF